MSDETTLLREKLNKLIIEIERLDIKLDSPAYGMTLGEYEQEREKLLDEFEQAIAATLGSEREAKLIRAMEDVLRHATDTVWVGEIETLVDRMVSLDVYGCEVYEGARPWEVD